MTLDEILTAAHQLGKIAAETNRPRVPALDPGVMTLVQECDKLGRLESPKATVLMLKAWLRGYQVVVDEECAKILEKA